MTANLLRLRDTVERRLIELHRLNNMGTAKVIDFDAMTVWVSENRTLIEYPFVVRDDVLECRGKTVGL